MILLRLMDFLRETFNVSYRCACHTMKLAYSTFMRWKSRSRRSEPLVRRPGPKKVKSLEIAELMEEIKGLRHRKKRTHETGDLYEGCRDGISRRDLQGLVKRTRDEIKRERRSEQRRIAWKQPGLTWSMDDTEFGRDKHRERLFLHNVQDLASRYKFPPLGGRFASGERVAQNLEGLFSRLGAPLILKRDNGSNLNHHAVDEVLSKYGVIPLNSPTYYPPYNGAIEKSQGELKPCVREKLGPHQGQSEVSFQALAEAAAHDLNHKPRRILHGQNSCQVFFSKKGGVNLNKRRRGEIFEWIRNLFSAIMEELGNCSKKTSETAWRTAVETWLHMNGFIEVSINGKVLPNFSLNWSHN
jgi:transposase InsO family protein